MSESINFTTPVGRLVGGDLFKAETKDAKGNPLVIKNGANAGQPTQRYNFGLAIAKNSPEWPTLQEQIHNAGKSGFPQYFDANGQCVKPDFAFKITDGDSTVPNTSGKTPASREGYPGHWVIWFSGSFAPKVYDTEINQLTDPNSVKRGYYIRVIGSVAPNGSGSDMNPGVFMNYSMVQLCGYGPVIETGPDPKAAFAAAPVLPTGASATPVAPTSAPAQAAAPAPATQMPAPSFTPPPVNAAPTPPGYVEIGNSAHTSQQAPAQPAAPVAPAADFLEPKRNVNGQIITEQALRDNGWTEEQIKSMPAAQ